MRDDKYFGNMDKKAPEFETHQNLQEKSWYLKSIYETGIVPDMATYKDVEVVFGPLRIYAMYGNRTDRFDYKFISPKIFKVWINDHDTVKCRIKKFTDNKLIFYADYNDGHFIVEMER